MLVPVVWISHGRQNARAHQGVDAGAVASEQLGGLANRKRGGG